MARFSAKVAIVTGGGGGIGSECARLLARESAAVVIADLVESAAMATAQSVREAGGQALGVACDISDACSVGKMVGEAVNAYGGIDLLFANAADTGSIDKDSNCVDVPIDTLRKVIDVNLIGTVLCARACIPEMLKRGGGAIVFTTSRAAHSGYPKIAYAMTKTSVTALARHICSTWGKQGIRANCIAPGATLTARTIADTPLEVLEAIMKNNNVPRLGEPADIAAAAAFFLSDESAYVNGQQLMVSGGQFY
jgi:NAD(P)-dependent dehydrogenase (short-subunit alcohol dehydrogenase family)